MYVSLYAWDWDIRYSCYLGRFRRYVIQTKLDQSESVAQNPDLFVYFVRKILNNISARGGI